MSWPAGSKALPWRSILMAPLKFFWLFRGAREGGISFLWGQELGEEDPCPSEKIGS